MKRLMLFMTIAAMLLAASVSAQTQAPPAAKDAAPVKAQAAPAGEAGKKETKQTKMTKKTKKADALEGQFKPAVR